MMTMSVVMVGVRVVMKQPLGMLATKETVGYKLII